MSQETLFRILAPTLFIAIFEAVFFFKITKMDIEHQLSKEYVRGNVDLKGKVGELEGAKRGQAVVYLSNVHSSSTELLKESEREKRAANTAATRNAVLIVVGIFLVLVYLEFQIRKAGGKIPWTSVAIQTVGTLIAVGIFQVYFYYNVGRKYRYESTKVATKKLHAKFSAESRLAGLF